ncbi:MAG: (2Fe-2S)-binding protein [Fimbriimonadia bacterium]
MPKRIHSVGSRTEVRFRFNGRSLKGYEGEPVAAALLANGIEYLHRSAKLHHPRGVRCANGRCGQCIVSIDGRPNVRCCVEPLRGGMDVRSQTGWPSSEFDLLRPLGGVVAHLPHGFHYRMFIRPLTLRPLIYRFVRSLGGYGKADLRSEKPESFPAARKPLDVDVLIVGGGVAGLSCALAVCGAASSVVILDDQFALGGHARFDPRGDGMRLSAELCSAVASHDKIETRLRRMVVSYDAGVVAAATAEGIEKFRPRVLVLATGGYDYIPPFEGNDKFGVFGERAILRLLVEWGVTPAPRCVVAGEGAEAFAEVLSRLGVYSEAEPVLRRPSPEEAFITCGSIPTYELQYQTGLCMGVDERGAAVALLGEGGVSSRPDVFVTGEAAGSCGYAEAVRRGAETGAAVARTLEGEIPSWTPAPSKNGEYRVQGPVPGAMLCFCEDVTEEEFAEALAGDFPDIESAKRYTSMSMGLCQGKYCLHRARELTAFVSGVPMDHVPMTTQRPPVVSVPLGVLAAQAEEKP